MINFNEQAIGLTVCILIIVAVTHSYDKQLIILFFSFLEAC